MLLRGIPLSANHIQVHVRQGADRIETPQPNAEEKPQIQIPFERADKGRKERADVERTKRHRCLYNEVRKQNIHKEKKR